MRKEKLLSILGLGIAFYLTKPHLLYGNPTFGGGSGTEQDPYRLSTPEHLTQLQVAVDGGNNFSGKYFILTDDIDLEGYDNDSNPNNGNFEGIGTESKRFSGYFDGQNYSIKNLRIVKPSTQHVGLFDGLTDATVENLKLENYYLEGLTSVGGLTATTRGNSNQIKNITISGEVKARNHSGGLIGQVQGNTKLDQISGTIIVNGNKKSDSEPISCVGGLVGQMTNGLAVSFSNISLEGSVSAKGDYVGGIIGYMKNGVIRDNYVKGEVSGGAYIGGLVGYASGSTVTETSVSGDVSGSSGVGGLVGEVSNSTISQSFATGDILGTDYVGGLVGFAYESSIERSSTSNNVEGEYWVGGLVGDVSNSTISQSFASGSVEGEKWIGGLVAYLLNTTINQSFASGEVSGIEDVGGLVGAVDNSTINNVYAIGNIEGTNHVGGLVGNNWGDSVIKNAYHLGSVTGTTNVGRISGWHEDTSVIENVYYNQEENVGLPIIGLDESTVELGQVIGLKEYQMSQTNSKNYMTLLDFENVWVTTSTTPMFRWQTDLMSANRGDIQINGNIQPMMADVTIPSVSPDLVIDPNSPEGALSPEFSIENQSTSPIKLELKTFEQTTNTFNDVLPDKYDSWEGLNKTQSQDIALGLVAKEGDGWQRLTTPTSYVANHQVHEIGVIKPTSQVNFEFEAHHGRAFSEAKTVQYRMVFVFDLLN